MRYTPLTKTDITSMLEVLGVDSIDQLLSEQIPRELGVERNYELPDESSESSLMRHMRELSERNTVVPPERFFLGAGLYRNYVPALVRAITSRPEFMTSYTPYQPEVSQGTLKSIFDYQTMMSELTAMPVSNASMYDGASSLAEAVKLAMKRTDRKKVVFCAGANPEYVQTVATYIAPYEGEVACIPQTAGISNVEAIADATDDESACVVVFQPNFLGFVDNVTEIAVIARAAGALSIGVVNPCSLGLLVPPGEWGADIAVGEGQPLGLPISFGGPGFGFFTTTSELLRELPGRVCGMTTDSQGREGYVLTLQAREQHIRRERATSNICTNQQLAALAATIYLMTLGRSGIQSLSAGLYNRAHLLSRRIKGSANLALVYPDTPFFGEILLNAPDSADGAIRKAHSEIASSGYEPGLIVGEAFGLEGDAMLVAVNDQMSDTDIAAYVDSLDNAVSRHA